jgi:hypothetical protein
MDEHISSFRDGIFALRTRRFGKVAELMIQKLTHTSSAKSQFHDLYDDAEGKRVEVKFSTVMKENDETINANNLIDQCLKATVSQRSMKSEDVGKYGFDCNIQQVKTKEFDLLYYGLFFANEIAIFKMESHEIASCYGYSDFQHKGNVGEGQFHLNQDSYAYHLENHLVQWMTYEELYDLFAH